MMEELLRRGLPPLPAGGKAEWPAQREELARLLCREEYGFPPPPPRILRAEVLSTEQDFCAGKAVFRRVRLTAALEEGDFSFPIAAVVPKEPGPHPFFVLLNFRGDVPDRYLPSEEICDRGYGVVSLDYQDISPDRAEASPTGLGALLPERPGKLALWAWAGSRALDWALTQPELDGSHAAVIGHSRLGKTALLCGMLDQRFAAVISNDSGCSGAAITQQKQGERVADITRAFPFWFCEGYPQYAGREEEMPFDQHFLLAAIAPRLLCVGSAAEDQWACPDSEYLCCAAASEAWSRLGKKGFVHPERLPRAGDVFQEGEIGYHLRAGAHYLSREDWNRYMDFLDQKGWRG